jgi:hypothetical protein
LGVDDVVFGVCWNWTLGKACKRTAMDDGVLSKKKGRGGLLLCPKFKSGLPKDFRLRASGLVTDDVVVSRNLLYDKIYREAKGA